MSVTFYSRPSITEVEMCKFQRVTVISQFVTIALICNTSPNLEYILPQFVIAALFSNNGCPNLQ